MATKPPKPSKQHAVRSSYCAAQGLEQAAQAASSPRPPHVLWQIFTIGEHLLSWRYETKRDEQ